MPWKETCVVDQREEFVKRVFRKDMPMAALCREYQISTKTGYKWLERYAELGRAGLVDRSRRPHSCQRATEEDVICALIRFKEAHPSWGPTKIRRLYELAHPGADVPDLSTVKRILGKAGLAVPRRRRRTQADCGRLTQRFDPTAPNQLWSVDFKGHWYTPERERILPLTVCDAYSRMVLAALIVPDASTETVQACFVELFQRYGLPLTIRSDNGAPFASTRAPLGLSRLSVWWTALGINLDRIAPGHPEQNGRHERMHLEIAREVEGRFPGNLRVQQAALDLWREEFNHVRPHAALALRTPAEFYQPSPRRFTPELAVVEYPLEFWRRKVSRQGYIQVDQRLLPISSAFAGWELGLQPLRPKQFNVWFGALRLGILDVTVEKFTVLPAAETGLAANPLRHYHQSEPLPMS